MARTTKPLSNTQIEKAKPKEKDYTLSDGQGLYLLIKSTGAKLWRFNYYKPITKKRTEISLGSFPAVQLAEARAIREEYRVLLAQGIDPKTQKEKEEQEKAVQLEHSFKTVANLWRESKSTIKPLTLKKYWAIIENYLMPTLGKIPVNQITPLIAKTALDMPYHQNKAEMFRKSVKLLNAILNYAVYSLFLIPSNPCEKIITAYESPVRGEIPTIKPDELPDFFDRLENSNLDLITKYLIQWQLLTMVRPNEAVTAEYADIDEEKGLWIIPSHKMKQTKSNRNEDHIVPLSKQSIALLANIKRLSLSGYLFPSLRSESGHLSGQTANKAIRDGMGYKGKLKAHGLRKIASTYLHEAGILPDVVELCLAHTIKGIRGVYNKAEYLSHRKAALQKWGNYVEQCQLQAIAPHLKIVA
ncbi:tyrosine-type recombinase/integrase [Rodentibacter caecimuris]|uniref:tyrosine-type recombinase/integrase n=1 Tax=Rodentibacter caecimuris TaxID=1796644 RepID=UPI002119DE7C|nr:integrase arm-type DNA-binding domain-containing protein [Rodentibacter heylii]MCQ9123315.1 integrase arm-type DNA-binding domain-containing protein [Rodentibacter heylii]